MAGGNFPRYPINPRVIKGHALNNGLVAWLLQINPLMTGPYFYELMGIERYSLVNFSSGGLRGTTRPGGKAHLLFNGTNSVILGADATTITSPALDVETYTLSAWIRTTSGASTMMIINKANGASTYPYAFSIVNGAVTLKASDGTLTASVAGGSVADGLWHHIAATRIKGTSLTVYVDGLQVATGLDTTISTTNSTAELTFGASNNAGITNPFSGSGDDFKIYNYAMSAAQIFQLYNESRLGYPTALSPVFDINNNIPAAAAPPLGGFFF